MPDRPHVCVFCGSQLGARPEYAEAARRIGAGLARRGVGLVYGGGRVGLMGAVADAALAAGGRVVGVIPRALALKEVAHEGVTELLVVPGMHERKALMAERADAFLALPGGVGTFEELFEIVTWAVLGIHRKPLGLLDVAGYYGPIRRLMDDAVREKFLRPEHRALLRISDDPDGLVDSLLSQEPPPAGPVWFDLSEA